MKQLLKTAVVLFAGLASGLCAGLASAQAWPTKPIRIVVPYSAGGAVDVMTRLIAGPMGRELGQTVVVEPRPGGEGNIAALAVAKAPADGYTLLSSSPILTSIPLLFDNLQWKLDDFAPVGRFATSSGFIISSAKLPVKTLGELVAQVKQQPGLPSAVLIGGAHTTFTTKMLAKSAGIDLVFVPYQGAAQHMADLYEGRVGLATVSGSIACSSLANPRVNTLAMTGEKRSPAAPDVPTTAEAGYPQVNAGGWYGLHAPAGTPPAVIDRLAQALGKALETEEVKVGLQKACVDIGYLGVREFGEYVAADVARWKRAVELVGK